MIFLLACVVPAEWAEVDVPKRGGVEALSHEDLSRDLWMLTDGRDPEALVHRLEELGLEPEGACGRARGEGPGTVVLAGDPPDDGPEARSGQAVLLSVAKTFDGQTPPRDLLFCPEMPTELPGDARALLTLGPMDGRVTSEEGTHLGIRRVSLSAPRQRTGSDDILGAIDWRNLEEAARRVREAALAL